MYVEFRSPNCTIWLVFVIVAFFVSEAAFLPYFELVLNIQHVILIPLLAFLAL